MEKRCSDHLVTDWVLLAPSFLVAGLILGAVSIVESNIPIQRVASLFWTALGLVFAVSLLFFTSYRAAAKLFALPLVATFLTMAPYLVHGMTTFPGSSLWDGFAYMAGGEALWSFPRNAPSQGLPLLYDFGLRMVQPRFASSAILAFLKLTEDVRPSVGPYLFVCVFTFASGCYALARVLFSEWRLAQIAFVFMATVSGIVVTLISANNFDNILALSLTPGVIALALTARFANLAMFALLAIMFAAMLLSYPEVALILALPAPLVLILRPFQERVPVGRALLALTVLCAVFSFFVAPRLQFLYQFVVGQYQATLATDQLRPGNGYFPSFFVWPCAPGAWAGYFPLGNPCSYPAIPYATTLVHISGYATIVLLAAAATFVLLGIARWRRALPFALSFFAMSAAAAHFIVIQHYDYGAFKIFVAAWIPFSVLVVMGLCAAKGRGGKIIGLFVVAGMCCAGISREVVFELQTRHKSIIPYAELQDAMPRSGLIEVRVRDAFAFEWAAYYLRHRRAVYAEGSFVYYPTPPQPNERPQWLLTDYALPNAKEQWSNEVYNLYKAVE